MIRNISKLPGALKVSDLDTKQWVGKLAIDGSFMRGAIVGQLLGRITRVTDATVFYERSINDVVVKESRTSINRIAFIVDTEEEYNALDEYDRARRERLESRAEEERKDFANRVLLHNATDGAKGFA